MEARIWPIFTDRVRLRLFHTRRIAFVAVPPEFPLPSLVLSTDHYSISTFVYSIITTSSFLFSVKDARRKTYIKIIQACPPLWSDVFTGPRLGMGTGCRSHVSGWTKAPVGHYFPKTIAITQRRASTAKKNDLRTTKLRVNQARLMNDIDHTCQWGKGERWGE